MVGLTAILREAWSTSQQTEDRREKIQALSLAKDCYSMKLDLLTNATVVDDAIRFVSSKQKGYHRQQILTEGEEKAKDNSSILENQDNSSNDIQGSEEENQQQQYAGAAAAAATTNQTF